MRKPLFSFLLVSAAALAQTVTLEGDVVRKSTGKPLSGVRVAAQGRQTFWAATDATGHFRFSGLPLVASCTVSLIRPGWLPRDYFVTITPQDTHVTVRLVATPQAVIAGKVVDAEGWPVVGASVTAAQYRTKTGVRQLERVGAAQANDLGEYRIATLPPGRYYLRIHPPLGRSWGEDYEPTWYPAADDVERARPIDLREGQEVSIDVRLGPRRGVEVRGHVTWLAEFRTVSGPVPALLRVSQEELRDGSTESFPIAADGNFTLRHVMPGKYTLAVATSRSMDDSMPSKYSTVQTIQVSSENIDGIKLNVAETVIRDLPGTIVCEGAVRPDQVRISLQRVRSNTALIAKVAPDGSFVIPGVWPGRYRAAVAAEGAEAKSIRFGDREIRSREFDFDGTDAPLRVTVAPLGEPVRLSGTATDANHRPLAFAALVFVPTGQGNRVSGSTDQNGTIFGWGLVPGVYRVYVIADPADTEQAMADPAFLKSQEQAFPPLTVVAGENPPLQLVSPGK